MERDSYGAGAFLNPLKFWNRNLPGQIDVVFISIF